ncbi:MAG: hypothetical protein M3158_09340 [Pseudomonadota bacterium]|nr:hypothetical protein [Pseudomonadota bacterium]
MISFSAPLVRGLSVLGIGAGLATGHILFAAAAPARAVPDVPPTAKAADVETTSSVASRPAAGENCDTEQQIVRSVRGRPMMLSSRECD